MQNSNKNRQTERTAASRPHTVTSDLELETLRTSPQQASTSTTTTINAQAPNVSMVSSSEPGASRTTSSSMLNDQRQPQEINRGSPPPYPGPPLQSTHPLPTGNDLPPSYHHASFGSPSSSQSVHSSQLYYVGLLNQHGQNLIIPLAQLPGQIIQIDETDHNTVPRISHNEAQTLPRRVSSLKVSIHNFVHAVDNLFPYFKNLPQSTAVNETSNCQFVGRAQHTTNMRINHVQREPSDDFLGMSIACLILCICQANFPALLCIIPAFYCSAKV